MSSQTPDPKNQVITEELLYQAVGHRGDDDVAVTARDLSSGEKIRIRFLDESEPRELEVCEDIPLGHKLALRSIHDGENVTEYGRNIGCATSEILKGACVHVHNLQSLRW